jgi:hypothetical protein
MSFAKTSIALAPESSLTVALSLTAVGEVSTDTMVTVETAVLLFEVPSVATKWITRGVVSGSMSEFRYRTLRSTVWKLARVSGPVSVSTPVAGT